MNVDIVKVGNTLKYIECTELFVLRGSVGWRLFQLSLVLSTQPPTQLHYFFIKQLFRHK